MSASVEMKDANNSRLDEGNYEYFWGCELNEDKLAVTWSFEDEEGDTDFLIHTLFLKHAVLGAKAEKGERNLVQVETKNYDGESIAQPLFSLTLGQNDCCFLDASFGHRIPVTLRLVQGKGPVFISAQHLTEFPSDANLNDSQEDLYVAEETVEDEDDDSPVKQAKKRKAGAQKSAKTKKGKLDASADDEDEDESMDEDDENDIDEDDLDDNDEEDDDEDEDDDDEEEEESPKKRGKPKAKNAKGGKAAPKAKAKKPVKAANGKAAAKKGKKAKA